MTRRFFLAILASAVFFLSGCNDFLSQPPGSLTVALEAAPTAVVGIESCTITWSTNVETRHILDYGTAPGVYTESTELTSAASTDHTASLASLQPGTIYYYRIRSYYQTYPEALSAEYSFTIAAVSGPTLAQRARGIWIVGGCSANYSAPVAQIDLFDPVTKVWFPPVTSLPTPVSFAAVGTGTFGGHRVIVVAGGFDGTGTTRNIVQRYDVDAAVWLADGQSMPVVRANVDGVTHNNCLYVLGGSGTVNASTAYSGTMLATTYEYNIGGDTWSPVKGAAMTTGGPEKQTVAYDDTILYTGGRWTATNTMTTAHQGVIITGTGAETGGTEVVLTSARTGHAVVSYTPASGSTLLVAIGGFTTLSSPNTFSMYGTVNTSVTTNLVQYLRYPFTLPSAWTTCTSFPVGVAYGEACVYGDTLYYFGGVRTYDYTSCQASVYSTDLDDVPSLVWASEANMPVSRYGHAAVRF